MDKRYLTVTALTKYLKRKLETDKHLRSVWLQAEISNFNHHSRGHMYFTLKDQNSRISAVMFSFQNKFLKFRPENGMKVLVKGEVNLYEPQGQYQLYVQAMEPDGIGSLYLAYEELKKKLTQEGLFQDERKKQIPSFPNHIGIITSPTGAAIRDILTTIERRFPFIKRTLLPVNVQGRDAAPSIVKAIEKANGESFDVLIIGRGGGSIEELWAFNEEQVARAIAKSSIPIISAVGHETDFTISDFVADLRAPTPTAAAELAVPSMLELHNQLNHLENRLNYHLNAEIRRKREQLKALENTYAFKYPVQLTQQKEQDFDRLVASLDRNMRILFDRKEQRFERRKEQMISYSPRHLVAEKKSELHYLSQSIVKSASNLFDHKATSFYNQLEKLTILSPLETMKRGYGIVYEPSGKLIKSTDKVSVGDQVRVSLSDGMMDCKVEQLIEGDDLND
ncbi:MULTISPECIES: exodeoxyribonuclease VII large subunit [Allobacillus]|uniref:Exodeoxyribonuclease 7 large subunit n=1 Tax=Allobacillus salarius TaxID=1955272 RepID=A0A556PTF1_9BACI|nr:exodeoxyribonuclease VII large subunit [Allobacillus salarius]TSJ67659.1 exodeoxyribonuclease VII large subunit [Allobacillus salarius]